MSRLFTPIKLYSIIFNHSISLAPPAHTHNDEVHDGAHSETGGDALLARAPERGRDRHPAPPAPGARLVLGVVPVAPVAPVAPRGGRRRRLTVTVGR